MRCERCGYVLTRVGCPICGGKQIKGMEPIGAIIPRALRAFFVVEQHFESARHYRAWLSGVPLRSDRATRWKVPEKVRDQIMRHFGRKCQGRDCATPDATATIEHIVPVAFGGSNHPGNLTLLCGGCQSKSWARFQALLSPNAHSSAA